MRSKIDKTLEAIDAKWKSVKGENKNATKITEEICKIRKSMLSNSGVPERIRSVIDTAKITQAIEAVSEAENGCYVLSGPCGSGKSVAAGWWIWQWILRDDRPRAWAEKKISPSTYLPLPEWRSAHEIVREKYYSKLSKRKIATLPRLVIDDLGNEFVDSSGLSKAVLDEIVNVRYEAKLPTVITTNLTAEAFKKRYDERIVSRIRGFGKFCLINGDDMRKAEVS